MEKIGFRKVRQDNFNGVLMILGLIAILVAGILSPHMAEYTFPLSLSFFAGITGKQGFFNWGNAMEHKYKNGEK